MLNTKIKDYLIQRELGRGGMAVVYLAHDNKFDTQVAVKVLNKEYVHNYNIRKRFLAEARNMYRMSHPNIIKVTDLIDDGDTVAFVMEYIEGETLKEYLERKSKLKDEEIKSIFTQMLDAVGYVHEQNLVHRDIKPSNFMLDKKGKVRLLDFGIAKNTDAKSAEYTQTGTVMQMGTPMYMSPEQVKSAKEVLHTSDIYSLGVVLWQMVSGRKPYDNNTLSTVEIHIKILQDTLSPTHTVWDSLIEKATQKEAAQRYAHATEFKQALERIDASAPLSGSEKTVWDYTASKKVKSSSDEDKWSSETNLASSPSPQALSPKKSNLAKKIFSSFSLLVIVILAGLLIRSEWKRVKEIKATAKAQDAADSARVADSLAAIAADKAQAAADSAVAAFRVMNLEDSLGIKMILVPGAPYYLSETEMTQRQVYAYWRAIHDKRIIIKPRPDYPQNYISWEEANAFCKWAGGRLPTVEEWQYSARAGSNFIFAGSNNINEVAWYKENSRGMPQPVKTKLPNAYGLYDMSGNVMEWTNTISGNKRALCGGGYNSSPELCRIANYTDGEPSFSDPFIGFRLLIPISSQEY